MAKATSPAPAPPVVVALAGSGGRADPIAEFVTSLQVQDDVAMVIVLQHREALEEKRFAAVLRDAGRHLIEPSDGAPAVAGATYLRPADVIATLDGGSFRLRPAQEEPGERGTVDSFLVSLGEHPEIRGIAVLLGDMGGEGTLGAGAIKDGGGIVLAERLGDEQGAELASSNSPAALADAVLPVPELAKRVDAYAQKAGQNQSIGQLDPEEHQGALASIIGVLRNKTGHDFHGYKTGTFLRRVQRRMQVVDVESVTAYFDVLRDDELEPLNLFNDLLIGVTQFFRDKREFEVLEKQVIPKLFQKKGRDDHLRVWVIGCSTGEEAYSIAILLREHMATLSEVPHVQIFASDLDGRALASARVGRYSEAVSKDVSPERLARWFVKEGNTYCITKELREMCIFSQHSIIKDAPFSRLDLISCRNLLIYLDAEMQGRVVPLFHFALRPNGYLFLGNAENVSRHSTLFAPVESRSRIFQRLETGTRILPDFPFTAVDRRPSERLTNGPQRHAPTSLTRSAERIVERYAPAYVIVDGEFYVLHFSGNTGRFISPSGGSATLNILNLVHPDLRLDLRAALNRAMEEEELVRAPNLRMGSNGSSLAVEIIVEPILEGARRNFVVVFKETGGQGLASEGQVAESDRDEHVLRLEAELRSSNERLQATIEELESTNEELKSANEEYQSLNEELQSANEELETSKEELQSINEELTTVNGELSHRVQEVGRANSDLKNLLESTQIATVFLDNELRVMNFTPAISDIFPLVEADIGRPITHIRARISFEDLLEDVKRVMRTLATVERDMVSTDSTHYMVRVLPYRSVDNFIGGVVITFTDLTTLTQAQLALRQSEERFRVLVDLVPELVWSSDPTGWTGWFNRRWLDYTGQTAEQAQGWGWIEAIHPEDRKETRRQYEQAMSGGELPNRQHRIKRHDGEYRWFLMRAEPSYDEGGTVLQWFGSATDIHEQRMALEVLQRSDKQNRLLLSELQHRVRNTLAVVRSIARRSAETSESVDDYAAHLDGRLAAFARVQAVVTRDPATGIDLAQLIAEELQAHHAHEGRQVEPLEGPQLLLQPKAAELIGLAIHELAINAVKYGALAHPEGHIAVKWSKVGKGEQAKLVLDWRETGVTLAGTPERRGFGTDLLERSVAYDLDGTTVLEFRPSGVHCTITLPLDRVALQQE